MKGLNSAAGYLRTQISHELSIRRSPQLLFVQDDSIAHGSEILKLIAQVVPEEEKE
jgi:ribosome-binding factor A